MTVPAYQALWSSHDDANHHFRRYGRRQLLGVTADAGWGRGSDTFFNSLLLVPAAAVRMGQRLRSHAGRAGRSDLDLTPGALDGILTLPLAAEATLIGSGGRLPAGLSLLAVFVRPV